MLAALGPLEGHYKHPLVTLRKQSESGRSLGVGHCVHASRLPAREMGQLVRLKVPVLARHWRLRPRQAFVHAANCRSHQKILCQHAFAVCSVLVLVHLCWWPGAPPLSASCLLGLGAAFLARPYLSSSPPAAAPQPTLYQNHPDGLTPEQRAQRTAPDPGVGGRSGASGRASTS